MRMRLLIPLAVLVFLSAPVLAGDGVWRLAFGSCSRADRPQPFWDAVRALRPEVWCWAGDNIYADTTDMERMRALYAEQKAVPGYAALVSEATTVVVGTWDDHDFGKNDAGREYPMRRESQGALLDFLGEPADSPRRAQEGVYGARTFGEAPRQVKVILLDTRYHRDPIGSNGTILGEPQWAWLERELTGSKAALHLVVSSIQVLAEEHRFEKWSNFPAERQRLLERIASTGVRGVVFLSGDRHHSEIARLDPGEGNPVRYPLFDVTSSSLTHPRKPAGEPNRFRVAGPLHERNFGLVEVEWATGKVRFAMRGVDGGELLAVETTLSDLGPR